jgi:hypothetical protein
MSSLDPVVMVINNNGNDIMYRWFANDAAGV